MTKICHFGILDITEEEFKTLIEIFDKLPHTILLTSTYIAIKSKVGNNLIPLSVIEELKKIYGQKKTVKKEKLIIKKIIDFQNNTKLIIDN